MLSQLNSGVVHSMWLQWERTLGSFHLVSSSPCTFSLCWFCFVFVPCNKSREYNYILSPMGHSSKSSNLEMVLRTCDTGAKLHSYPQCSASTNQHLQVPLFACHSLLYLKTSRATLTFQSILLLCPLLSDFFCQIQHLCLPHFRDSSKFLAHWGHFWLCDMMWIYVF